MVIRLISLVARQTTNYFAFYDESYEDKTVLSLNLFNIQLKHLLHQATRFPHQSHQYQIIILCFCLFLFFFFISRVVGSWETNIGALCLLYPNYIGTVLFCISGKRTGILLTNILQPLVWWEITLRDLKTVNRLLPSWNTTPISTLVFESTSTY